RFLSADPLDNKLRFRYVEWLSHRNPPRAEYLRRQAHLAMPERWNSIRQEAMLWLDQRKGMYPPEWEAACCPRLEVWLLGYHASKMAPAIRAIRDIRGTSLAEARAPLSALPGQVAAGG